MLPGWGYCYISNALHDHNMVQETSVLQDTITFVYDVATFSYGSENFINITP